MKIRLLAALVLTLLASALPGASSAVRADDAWPADREDFPACSEERTMYCVESFLVDAAGGTAFVAPPEGIALEAHLWAAWTSHDSFHSEVRRNGAQELDPVLPTGASARYTVNTGTWEPPSWMTSGGNVIEWSRSEDPVRGWSMTFEIRSLRATIGLNCSVSDGCDNPTDLVDLTSRISATIWGFPADSTPESQAYDDLQTGSYIGTNASGFSSGYLDQATQSVVFEMAGPHLTAAGAQNDGFLSAFLPDTLLVGFWGADPDVLAAKGAVAVVKTEGTESAPVQAKITRVEGGLRFEFSGFHFSSPKFTVKLKRQLPAPAFVTGKGGRRRAVLTIDPVARATSYQAVCSKGAKLVYATSDSPVVVMKKLAKGKWTCRGRGVRVAGGKWSNPVDVRVRCATCGVEPERRSPAR